MSKQYSKAEIKRQFDKKPFGDRFKKEVEKTMGMKFSGEAGLKKHLIDQLANKNEMRREEFYRKSGLNRTEKLPFKRQVEERIKAGEPPKISYKDKQELYKEFRKNRMANKLGDEKLSQANVAKRDEETVKRNIRISRDKTEAISRIRSDRESALKNVSANASLNTVNTSINKNMGKDLASSINRVGSLAKPISDDGGNPFSKPLDDANRPAVSIKKIL